MKINLSNDVSINYQLMSLIISSPDMSLGACPYGGPFLSIKTINFRRRKRRNFFKITVFKENWHFCSFRGNLGLGLIDIMILD